VTLYGTRTCGYCRQARTFFGANSVAFSDVSTESSAGVEAGFAHVARCGQPGRLSTPTVIIENSSGCHVMLGWGESQVRMYLGL
jgi:glutaredoxin